MLKIFIFTISSLTFVSLLQPRPELVFLPEHEAIFSPCDDNENDIHKFLDLSNLSTVYVEDRVHVEGSVKIVWNIEPHHRVSAKADLYRWTRNTWVPTLVSMNRPNFCKSFSSEKEIWYDAFVVHIPENQRVCFNQRGSIYHFEPFDFSLRTTLSAISGEDSYFKIKINFAGVDDDEDKIVSTFCFEIKGHLKKM